MNQIPTDIPPGPRYPASRSERATALAENRYRRTGSSRQPMEVAALPEPVPLPLPPAAPAVRLPQSQYASVAPEQRRGGFHLIAPAVAEPMPYRHTGAGAGNWAIQVGAFANPNLAQSAAETARGHASEVLAAAHPTIGTVRQGSNTLYRARLTGISRDAAVQACEKLARGHGACMVLSPEAQS
jgi:hypothetical protein